MKDLQLYVHIPVILLAAWILSWSFKKVFNRFMTDRTNLLNMDPTNFSFIRNGISFIIYIIAIILIFVLTPGLKGIGATLFASAGILAAIVGFASKEAFANIVSGIFIVIFRPFRVNDLLEFESGIRGVVEDITLRHTIIRDLNNKRVIVPNSNMSSQLVINYHISDKRIRYHYHIGISYESDVDKAIEIITQFLVARQDVLDNRTPEEIEKGKSLVRVRVTELFDSGVTLRADYWCKDFDTSFGIACKLNKTLLKLFKENNIEIPYPHRTITYKNSPDKV